MNVPWQAEIWALMKANKISRSDLAEAANITPEYLSMVLNGKRAPAGAEAKLRAALQQLLGEKEAVTDETPGGMA